MATAQRTSEHKTPIINTNYRPRNGNWIMRNGNFDPNMKLIVLTYKQSEWQPKPLCRDMPSLCSALYRNPNLTVHCLYPLTLQNRSINRSTFPCPKIQFPLPPFHHIFFLPNLGDPDTTIKLKISDGWFLSKLIFSWRA